MVLNVEKTDENENEDEKTTDLDLRTISVLPWKLTPECMEWKDKQVKQSHVYQLIIPHICSSDKG